MAKGITAIFLKLRALKSPEELRCREASTHISVMAKHRSNN